MAPISVSLTSQESVYLEHGMAPLATVDLIEGDLANALPYIQKRMETILDQNPWLTGLYVDKKQFQYHEKKRLFDIPDMLLTLKARQSPLDRKTTTYEELVKMATEHKLVLVAKNFDKQPFWRVALVPDKKTPETHFFLYLSLSHGIGDGFTYYTLYNMLVGGELIRALTPERIATSKEQLAQEIGQIEASLDSSEGLAVAIQKGILTSQMSLDKEKTRRRSRIFRVDEAKIDAIKQQSRDSSDSEIDFGFCSTHDILTSWILSNSGCPHGIMSINLRDQLEGHTKDHAFNAECDLYLRCPDDTATPSLIRNTTRTLQRSVTKDTPLNDWDLVTESGICLAENWSTFKTDNRLQIPVGRALVHLPCFNMKETLTAEMTVGIIFRPRPGKLAVLLGGTAKKLERLVGAPFESSSPFEDMFLE